MQIFPVIKFGKYQDKEENEFLFDQISYNYFIKLFTGDKLFKKEGDQYEELNIPIIKLILIGSTMGILINKELELKENEIIIPIFSEVFSYFPIKANQIFFVLIKKEDNLYKELNNEDYK